MDRNLILPRLRPTRSNTTADAGSTGLDHSQGLGFSRSRQSRSLLRHLARRPCVRLLVRSPRRWSHRATGRKLYVSEPYSNNHGFGYSLDRHIKPHAEQWA
jgi:hypothetical protein